MSSVYDRLDGLKPGTDEHRKACQIAGRELVIKFRPELRGEIAARAEELALLHKQDGKKLNPVICTERV